MGEVRVDVDETAIRAMFAAGGEVADYVDQTLGQRVADRAAELAPKRTGAGAASIDHELVATETGCESHISWAAEFFYLYFAEVGTVHEAARPFLRPALDAAAD